MGTDSPLLRSRRESGPGFQMNDLLVIGRGPSVQSFTGWGDFTDTMAVSSGIYAIPEDFRPPTHFVTMDEPKWFLHPLHDPDNEHAWQNSVDNWCFWKDERIQKHVPTGRDKRGGYRELPSEIFDVIPDHLRGGFCRELAQNMHLFGSQPMWGDYPSVTGWRFKDTSPPTFNDGPIGMWCDEGAMVRNSWFMAVQVAYRLGYRRLFFIGCDFRRKEYALSDGWTRQWWALAEKAGMEWFNLSPDSVLDFLPSGEGVPA